MQDLFRTRLQGEFFDGKTAKAHQVSLRFEPESLHMLHQESGHRYYKSDLAIEDLGEDTVRIDLLNQDGQFLIVRHSILVKQLQELGYLGTYKAKGKRAWLMFLGLSSASLIALLLFYQALTPLSYWTATQVPFEIEQQIFDDFVMRAIEDSYCEDPEALKSLETLKNRLLLAGSDRTWQQQIKVSIVNWDMVNAFALPGGRIVVTKGLLDSPKEQVAGVMAHEIGHLKKRHVLGEYIRGTALSGTLSILIGDYTGGLVIDPTMISNLVQNKFSREAEAEADHVALSLLDESGFDHRPMAQFFRSLEDEMGGEEAWYDKVLKFISTHPSHQERIAYIDSYQRQHPVDASVWDFHWQAFDESSCSD
ncbi:M48 family metallopeptidase [Pseudobacteriovorax antillogorgiicola]|uniref:Peptidase family M48 n=1 Tax=Pseudobacteriovorax antillogorgiicola TaxID=1513793 RepID=A0A1Y6BRF8_9BACT|nr:M48 family metallopeptidase [Pseudobacteriovorax antillogorgiicola]TCS54637.1 peptidase M48-like protein [Pseudobacteriovorax antillogorgiicola]SMF17099.1 Peptidase family M48 [Pseudobacteriovorax antillogorgiicola]